MNIPESNKLIAEFMGFPPCENGYYCELDSGFKIEAVRTPDQMEFSVDWNWLMPVLEEISNQQCYYTLRCSSFTLDNGRGFYHFSSGIDELIVKVYKGVVEFIEWHNKQSHD